MSSPGAEWLLRDADILWGVGEGELAWAYKLAQFVQWIVQV